MNDSELRQAAMECLTAAFKDPKNETPASVLQAAVSIVSLPVPPPAA